MEMEISHKTIPCYQISQTQEKPIEQVNLSRICRKKNSRPVAQNNYFSYLAGIVIIIS